MPIYEYACTKCGHQLEVMQKITDKPLARCPKCKSKLEKQFSQTSFQLKGAGWYATDYSRKGNGKADKKSDSATETKPETKPEKKPETAAA
jgi:putative FmdB family regulatory protein